MTALGFIRTPRSFSVLDATASPLVYALRGFEYLFLAPLPYLVFHSLIKYVATFRQPGASEDAEHQVRRAKSLIVSLMVAVIATDLVSKILGPEGVVAGAEVLVMAALVGYILVLGAGWGRVFTARQPALTRPLGRMNRQKVVYAAMRRSRNKFRMLRQRVS